MPSPATHLRAPLLWLLVPLMAGLTGARLWPPPDGGLLLLALSGVAAGAGAIWFSREGTPAGRLRWASCQLMSAGLAGAIMLHFRQPHLHEFNTRPPREVTVTVRVLQSFPPAEKARYMSGLGEITSAGEHDRELVGVRIYFSAIRRISVPPQRAGSYVMRGVVESLPADAERTGFDDYLANLGIRRRLTRTHVLSETIAPGAFRRFCTRAQQRLDHILRHGLTQHPATASLYVAMLLGAKAEMSEAQQSAFMRSGTFHIFSISGLHVGVIAVALQGLLQLLRVSRPPAVAASLAVLWLYVQITGASPPALRAFLMIAFLLASQVFRLPGNALAALTASALATLMLEPEQLFSTGFQMSYTVVVALVAMGVPLAEKWAAAWHPFALLPKPDWDWRQTFITWAGRKLLGSAAACWVAFLASTPSGIGYFGLFSPGSLVANLLIIPLSSLSIIAGFLSLLSGLLGLVSLSALFNAAAAITIIVTDWLLQRGTALPGVYFPAHFTAGWLAPASLVLMTAVMLAGAAGGWRLRYGGYWPPAVCLVLIALCGAKFD